MQREKQPTHCAYAARFFFYLFIFFYAARAKNVKDGEPRTPDRLCTFCRFLRFLEFGFVTSKAFYRFKKWLLLPFALKLTSNES